MKNELNSIKLSKDLQNEEIIMKNKSLTFEKQELEKLINIKKAEYE